MGDEVMNVKTEEGDNEQFRKPLAIATAATEEKKEPIEQDPQTCPYKPPEWAQVYTGEGDYSFEVLKDGQIVERIPLKAGWHLIDLGSTHKTRVNKNILLANHPHRLYVGHVVKFGLSTRLHVLTGPSDDVEPEVELPRKKKKAAGEDDGTSWGIDDNYATDEPAMLESALADAEEWKKREEFYAADPKKPLRLFFEREGLEMKFEFVEKGVGFRHQWVCRLELPIGSRGARQYAEAVVSGSKKEAQVQCALQACRILDQHQLLRPSERNAGVVTHNVRAARQLQDNDYYSSDEDNFYDRTGLLEGKRKRRRLRVEALLGTGKSADNNDDDGAKEPMRYEQLIEKAQELEATMSSVQNEIDALEKHCIKDDEDADAPASKGSADALDTFMAQLAHGGDGVDVKRRIRELRKQYTTCKHQCEQLKRLAKVAKPAAMPKVDKLTGKLVKDEKATASTDNSADADATQSTSNKDQGSVGTDRRPSTNTPELADVKPAKPVEDKKVLSVQPATQPAKLYTVELPPSAVHTTEEATTAEVDDAKAADANNASLKTRRSKVRIRQRAKFAESIPSSTAVPVGVESADYATWLPPDTQRGDGRTTLNDKLGY